MQLAHRLVALQTEETHLKEEMEKVKEALWAYAEKKGVEVVFTKEHKVRIKVYENIRFPGKKDPSRSALEKLVKDGGKWEEVSLLDVFALSKVLQKGGRLSGIFSFLTRRSTRAELWKNWRCSGKKRLP